MEKEAKILIVIALLTIVVVVGGALLIGNSSSQSQKEIDTARLIRKESQQSATTSAKIQLVEFADFQCPACAAYQPIVDQLKRKYKGSLNVVFRHFPLNSHKNAIPAAKAAEAASRQGKFYEMEALLYSKQAEWENEADPTPLFLTYAARVKLNLAKFKNDTKAKEVIDEINQDIADGIALGVNSTPTFFLNGKKLINVGSVEGFSAAIDPLLK